MRIDPTLRALADPTRLRIMRLLAAMELAVGELASARKVGSILIASSYKEFFISYQPPSTAINRLPRTRRNLPVGRAALGG